MKFLKGKPNLFLALLPIAILILLLTFNVRFFGDDTLAGSNQVALILSAAIAGVIAWLYGVPYVKIRESIVHNISTAMPAMLILLLIGSLAGTWLISGVVPALIFYGLEIIHPSVFLFTAVVVSSVVSLVTGSSWSTIATVGVALLGIGKAMGYDTAMVAGAIISGAYFGDKMSPLSDTTNLAPAMAGTDLFTHIRYMMITTVPAIGLTMIIFLFMGFFNEPDPVNSNIEGVQQAIENTFNLTPLLFLVPVILIVIIIRNVAPLPALLIGTLLGAAFAIVFQSNVIYQVTDPDSSYFKASYLAVMQSVFGDVRLTGGNPIIDELFSTSGMAGMLNTIWLIIAAMVFGGAMAAGGLLEKISVSIIKLANSTGSLIAATISTSIFFNITASDQYIAIVVPGRMFRESYRKRNLKPEVLSRTLEDGGTVTSVLVPWNTGGATQARVLGVSTLMYLPYCFFNILSPLIGIIIGFINFRIRYYAPDEPDEVGIDENQRRDY